MKQDAIGLLAKELHGVCTLLDELAEASEPGAARDDGLLGRVVHVLEVHDRLAEDVFYPALERHAGHGAEVSIRANAEHRAMERMVLPDLARTQPGTPEFTARVRLLQEVVERHARQEEEDLLTMARACLGPEQLADLARRLDARRGELQ